MEEENMKIKNLLPVGSVVLLKNGEKRLMIDGVLQTDDGGNGKEYDYIGVLYPEGHIGEEHRYLFNQNDIEKVYFRGYEDEERTVFIEKLDELYNKR